MYSSLTRAVLPAVVSLCMAPLGHAATFKVGNSAELRSALAEAQYNAQSDIIELAPGTYSTQADGVGTFLFQTSEDFDLTLRASINGSADRVVLDGNGTDRVLSFVATGTQQLNISGLAIQNGVQGMYAKFPNIVLDNVLVRNNKLAGSASSAAGIDCLSVESVSIKNSVFVDNTGHYAGGAMIKDGAVTISNTKFLRNRANHSGAGIHLRTTSKLELTDSLFEQNEQMLKAGAAIHLAYAANTRISRSTFRKNKSAEGVIFGSLGFDVDASEFIGNISTDGPVIMDLRAFDTRFYNIHNNLFQDNTGGIEGSAGPLISMNKGQINHNVFVDNQVSSVIHVIRGASDYDGAVLLRRVAAIANNIFRDPKAVNLVTADEDAFVHIYNNLMVESRIKVPSTHLRLGGNFNDSNDAIKLDAAYRPGPGSSLIDAGIDTANFVVLPPYDADGQIRNRGKSADVGRFEYAEKSEFQISALTALDNRIDAFEEVTYQADFTLTAGATLASASVKVDGSDLAHDVELDSEGKFALTLYLPGERAVELTLRDSMGKVASRKLNVRVEGESVEELAAKWMDLGKQECSADATCSRYNEGVKQGQTAGVAMCQADPASCNIEAGANDDGSYDVGFSAGVASCLTNPASCDIEVGANDDGSYDVGYTAGVASCQNDPLSCGIQSDGAETELFSLQALPGRDGEWKLLGSTQEIRDLSVFNGIAVVWFKEGNDWLAYTPIRTLRDALAAKGYGTLTVIPAHSGFWVRK